MLRSGKCSAFAAAIYSNGHFFNTDSYRFLLIVSWACGEALHQHDTNGTKEQ